MEPELELELEREPEPELEREPEPERELEPEPERELEPEPEREPMKATHQKKPYRAEALQWTGTNTAEIIAALPEGTRADAFTRPPYNIQYLLIRHGREIQTITPGWWIVRGENGDTKLYDPDVFNVKYQPLKEPE